ncbi:hypothetical protein MTO96_047284 [Rhipicephalus appendiculatus]
MDPLDTPLREFPSRVRSCRPACAPPSSPAVALPGPGRTTYFRCASTDAHRTPATDDWPPPLPQPVKSKSVAWPPSKKQQRRVSQTYTTRPARFWNDISPARATFARTTSLPRAPSATW